MNKPKSKTIPMPKPQPPQERQPQLVVVDIEKLQAALNIVYELLAEKPTLKQVLINGVGQSILGPFSSNAQEDGQ